MNIKLIAATVALLACATPGFAEPVNLNFESGTSFGFVNNFYNGGTDSGGASGTNFHVKFGPDLMTVVNDGIDTYFSGPLSLGTTVMGPVGTDASISASLGQAFAGTFSFLYSADQAFSIFAYSYGGTTVGQLDLLATNTSCGISLFCAWNQATLNLTGLASRVDLGGGAGIAAFDNIEAVTVPEPATTLLMVPGLVMLARARLRRRRTA